MDSYEVRNQADDDENENLGSETDEDEQLTEDKGYDTQQEQQQERVFSSKSFHNPLASTKSTPWSIEKRMKKLSIHPKMVAVVEGVSPPFPVTYSLWKAQDGQKRLSLAMNLLSGIEGKAIAPEIDRDSIQVELKWPKATTSIAQFVPSKFLEKLHQYGHTSEPPPTSEVSRKSYPFQTVPVVQNLVEQLAAWKVKSIIPGEDGCPTMKIKLFSPISLDPVPIGNTFELQGLEGDTVKTKDHGYWSGVMLLECEGERNTFRKPVGPEHYTFVHRTIGGWSKKTEPDVTMGEATPEEEKTTGKRLRKSEPVVAHDLLVENLELRKKLEEQEHTLQKATQRIWSFEKYAKDAGDKLESMKKQYVSMEKALSQTQQEADTHARTAQDAVSAKAAVHEQVKPIVDLAMHAANNVQDVILAAQAQEPQEAVTKLVAEAQKALALAKNLSDEFLQK